jgi:hypothetical protein
VEFVHGAKDHAMTRRLALLTTAGLLMLAAPGSAQQPLRSGLWFELGRGSGNIRIGCATCERPTSIFGSSGFLRIGGSLSQRVMLGLGIFSLLDDRFQDRGTDSVVTLENSSIGPTVLWYPWKSGFYLNGGLGLTKVELVVPESDDSPEIITAGTGSGVHFGAGLDIPIRKWLSTSFSFGVYYSAIGDVPISADVVDDVITTSYHVGISVVIR